MAATAAIPKAAPAKPAKLNAAGAAAWFQTKLVGGVVPATWRALPFYRTSGGGYTLTTGGGYGNISWDAGNDPVHSLYVAWDKTTGAVTTAPVAPSSGQVTDVLTPVVSGAAAAADSATNAVNSIPAFLGKISSPDLWKRIGIGAAGAVILLIVVVIMFRKPIAGVAKVAAL